MLRRELHPLCCISIDCPGAGDRSPEPAERETVAVERVGSEGIAGGDGKSDVSVVGVLYKWTNFGKGWRSRWFTLRDGVLTYSKIRRREDSFAVGDRVQVIGAASARLSRPPDDGGEGRKGKKPVGVVYLQISSFRASKSDDRRFYIFSPTKTLYLKTNSKDDREAWIKALNSARSKVILSEQTCLFPNDVSFSTERLKARMRDAGVGEGLITECEQIMQAEFFEFHRKLKLHYEEDLDFFRSYQQQLEDVNVQDDVRTIHNGPLQLMKHEFSGSGHGKFSEYSTTESSDDVEKQELEELTDEEEPSFFDTKDTFSDSTVMDACPMEVTDSPDESSGSKDHNCARDMMMIIETEPKDGCMFPQVDRRKKLPDPIEKEKGVSLWSMIKDNVGKDLTRVCLPVYFNEPLSSLQKCFEDLEYSHLLDKAYEYGRNGDSLMRILNVAAFAVSGYACSDGRLCKPFNPLLGETYEADFPEKGVRFFSEKVSHHPMLIACHCEGKGWKFWGDSNLKSKFWGQSIQLDPVGVLTLEFDDGEIFQWSKVQGFVEDVMGVKVGTLHGKWDDCMYYAKVDEASKTRDSSAYRDATLLWRKVPPPEDPTRYNLTSFAITLNELTPELEFPFWIKEKLPPTDSRLRPDQRHLENGEYEKANAEKLRLEKRQRMSSKMQENGWKPRWFKRDNDQGTYRYVGGYWEAREHKRWEECPNIFGDLSDPTGTSFHSPHDVDIPEFHLQMQADF
ncbi:Oxysterol-binding protein-related protein 2A [Apostasia shenzhenica]|uniref:Oxysterol-binding protein-related protein 2A n=1 Tax=Apostasia shenzhenica TaxID=1088818 RepID=A0A2H9ZT65_9ASPA|nr:Oxysterol-binding protein-related protein 2A [Apostasia shenzhenica]